MTKEVEMIDKNEANIAKTVSYKLQFFDSVRLKVSSFSNLVDHLDEVNHKS